MPKCDKCGEEEDQLYKCDNCGEMFCDWCGSKEDKLCIDCMEDDEEDWDAEEEDDPEE